jgi:predicted transcriptional regulator
MNELIKEKTKDVPTSITNQLSREEILNIINENPNASDSDLSKALYEKIERTNGKTSILRETNNTVSRNSNNSSNRSNRQ